MHAQSPLSKLNLLLPEIIFTLFISTVSYAQFENIDIGARPVSVGSAFTSLADNSNAVYYNPSGISQLGYREISVFYSPAPFGLKELSYGAFNYVEPAGFGALGLSGKTYGFELYREVTLTVSYANSFKNKIFYGANLNYYNLKIERYGSASSFGVDAGMIAYLTGFLKWGFAAFNLNRAVIGRTKERLPQVYRTGICVQARNDLRFVLDVEKDTRYSASVKAGFEFSLYDMLDLRAGAGSAPALFSGGIGIYYSVFQLDYAFYNHQELGFTHQGSLTINFGGEYGRRRMRMAMLTAFSEEDSVKKISRLKKLQAGETVNINSAGIDSLVRIPFVSDKIAAAILDYKNQNGPFKKVEDLLNVKGIGEKKLEKMKLFIRLE